MGKVTVTVSGCVITATDGKRTRTTELRTPAAAKAMATRFKNDPAFAARWVRFPEPVQLDLPLPKPAE